MICIGIVFEIGGDEFSIVGQYMYIFVLVVGCDLVVMVNLQVDDVFINEFIEIICEGEFFLVGGNNYIMMGMYENSFIMFEGCDSIVCLDFMVILIVYNILMECICIGESFFVGGMDFDVSGIYIVIVLVVLGCDLVVILNLMVVDIVDMLVSVFICDGGIYIIGDSIFMVVGIYIVLFILVDGCDSFVVLDLNVIDFYEINLNVVLCEGEFYIVGLDIYDMMGMYINNFFL